MNPEQNAAAALQNLIVVYHLDCIDGLAAAWVVAQKWGDSAARRIRYIPYGHHDIAAAEKDIRAALQSAAAETALYFVDVAPTPAFLAELAQPGPGMPREITVIDHHKSACDALADFPLPGPTPDAPRISLHMDAHHPSAANMVWERLLGDRTPPVFFEFIAKMDLGRNLRTEDDYAAAALIDSRSIRTVEQAFRSFGALAQLSLQDMIVLGRNILTDQDTRISKLDDNIMFTPLRLSEEDPETKWVPVVNADVQNFGRYISTYLCQQGEATGAGIGFAWYVQGNGSVSVSLRSNGAPDASAVAGYLCKVMGIRGGGHRTSAAIHFPTLESFCAQVRLYSAGEMAAATA